MRTFNHFGAKLRIFRNLGCVCTDKGLGRGLTQCGQGVGQFFTVVRTTFTDGS